MREIETLSKLRNERVVRYMKTWIDNNNSLYIQMEFCCDNLRNILDVKHRVFGRESNDCIDITEYFISFKIFIEIVEAVKYLHDQSPPIIQRDIKPGNILFSNKASNGVYLKLCDFGLAEFYDGKTQTSDWYFQIFSSRNSPTKPLRYQS